MGLSPNHSLKKPIIKTTNSEKIKIESLEDLIKTCSLKKEINLKYDLETNVNLVSFENQRIEISFNEKLSKDFLKNLSSKLYEWTNERWIISLSKEAGMPSQKEKRIFLKNELLDKVKTEEVYKKVLDKLSDAELIDIDINLDKKND